MRTLALSSPKTLGASDEAVCGGWLVAAAPAAATEGGGGLACGVPALGGGTFVAAAGGGLAARRRGCGRSLRGGRRRRRCRRGRGGRRNGHGDGRSRSGGLRGFAWLGRLGRFGGRRGRGFRLGRGGRFGRLALSRRRHVLQDGGRGRHQLHHGAVARGRVVPDAVDKECQANRDQNDDAAGKTPLGQRQGEHEFRFSPQLVGLFLEAAHDLVAIQAQIIGIGAHETERIGGARQIAEPPLLDRFEIDLANTERVGHVRDG